MTFLLLDVACARRGPARRLGRGARTARGPLRRTIGERDCITFDSRRKRQVIKHGGFLERLEGRGGRAATPLSSTTRLGPDGPSAVMLKRARCVAESPTTHASGS